METIAVIFNAIMLGFWICIGILRKRIFNEPKINIINVNEKFFTVSNKSVISISIENKTIYYYKGGFFTDLKEIEKLKY